MRPIVWTIAGTDPGGGAGIQGDLTTLNALGVHGCSVMTALIAQNTVRVAQYKPLSAEWVEAQLAVLREDLPPAAIKIGLLSSAEIIAVVARHLRELRVFTVLDPVLGASAGFRFLDEKALALLRTALLPVVTLLTPNIPEAEELTGLAIQSAEDMVRAAARLRELGCAAVLIKGGHRAGATVEDYWTDGAQQCWFASPRLEVPHTHGTGCTLSSAIAACHALGRDVIEAIRIAKAYVNQGLRLGGGVGRGRGPLLHGPWPTHAQDFPRMCQSPGGDSG